MGAKRAGTRRNWPRAAKPLFPEGAGSLARATNVPDVNASRWLSGQIRMPPWLVPVIRRLAAFHRTDPFPVDPGPGDVMTRRSTGVITPATFVTPREASGFTRIETGADLGFALRTAQNRVSGHRGIPDEAAIMLVGLDGLIAIMPPKSSSRCRWSLTTAA